MGDFIHKLITLQAICYLYNQFHSDQIHLQWFGQCSYLSLPMRESHIGTYGLSCCTVYPEQYKTNDPGADLLGNDNNSLADSLYYSWSVGGCHSVEECPKGTLFLHKVIRGSAIYSQYNSRWGDYFHIRKRARR